MKRKFANADPLISRMWRCRWNFLRVLICAYLLYLLIADNPARLTRLQLAAMPQFDYTGEVISLRGAGRYAEALIVAESGRESLKGDALERLNHETAAVIAERDSYLRKAMALGKGAVFGHGDSLEELAGALTADIFIVGDIRDFVIQGVKYALDGEADEVVLALSAVGVFTTVVPQVDVVAALLKIARKTGNMTATFARHVIDVFRRSDRGQLAALVADFELLSKRLSPSGAIRLLKNVESPAELRKVSEFVHARSDGAFALHVTGKEGLEIAIKSGTKAGPDAVCMAARRGDAGIARLREGKLNVLRPHPLIGFGKGLWKGNVRKFFQRIVAEYLDPGGHYIISALALWMALEIYSVARRLFFNPEAGWHFSLWRRTAMFASPP